MAGIRDKSSKLDSDLTMVVMKVVQRDVQEVQTLYQCLQTCMKRRGELDVVEMPPLL